MDPLFLFFFPIWVYFRSSQEIAFSFPIVKCAVIATLIQNSCFFFFSQWLPQCFLEHDLSPFQEGSGTTTDWSSWIYSSELAQYFTYRSRCVSAFCNASRKSVWGDDNLRSTEIFFHFRKRYNCNWQEEAVKTDSLYFRLLGTLFNVYKIDKIYT